MTTRKPTESAIRQARDLAYQAMESYNPKEAIRLCRKAIELDPRCVDALVIMAGALEDLDERAQNLARVVQIAEEDLGGESYLEENKGYFWGLLETRPYMRARTCLAQTLHEAGKTDAAIAEYEALMGLNPNDNQGLRYVLMGVYLETGNVDGARRLRDEYGDEGTAVFAWSAVLERLVLGDVAGAEQSLPGARAANPFFDGYLLGRTAMPAMMPDYYGHGDKNEAIMCVDTIGDAWEMHPAAMRWLRMNEAPIEIAAKVKVGRNEPCPCGSGKKYKKCCLGREDAPSGPGPSPVTGEIMLNEIRQAIEGKEFPSDEEIQSIIRETNQKHDRRPIEDFEGLSHGQMHGLVSFPYDYPEVVEFSSLLSAPPSAPIVALFGMLADAIGEGGLKPTATGNLPLKVVRDIALSYMGEEEYAKYTRFGSIRSEDDYPDLNVTRIVAELAGLIRKYKGKFILSSKCRKLLKDGGMQAIYPVLLRTHAEEFNWGYGDWYPETGFVQSFFAYTLYLLDRHGDQWRENTFYEDAFLRAFPSLVDTVEPTAYRTRESIIREMYSLRCLERFAEFLGLVEIDRNSEDSLGRVFKLRGTPVLGDAVRFHLQV